MTSGSLFTQKPHSAGLTKTQISAGNSAEFDERKHFRGHALATATLWCRATHHITARVSDSARVFRCSTERTTALMSKMLLDILDYVAPGSVLPQNKSLRTVRIPLSFDVECSGKRVMRHLLITCLRCLGTPSLYSD